MRRLSQQGLALLAKLEGFSPRAYLDVAGIWTIGYGHAKNVAPDSVISPSDALTLLREDVMWAQRGFNDRINPNIQILLAQHQVDALIIFVYNVGNWAWFQSTLAKHVNANEFSLAAKEFSRWVLAGGKISKGLQNRRYAEQDLFLNGTYE